MRLSSAATSAPLSAGFRGWTADGGCPHKDLFPSSVAIASTNQKYFPAILSHSGQSCLELSFHTSSQFGIALPFRIAENLTF